MNTERRKKPDETSGDAPSGKKKPVLKIDKEGDGERTDTVQSKIKVLPPEESDAEPPLKVQSKIKVIPAEEGDRLTTEEWRQRFAHNLDRLLALVGLSRKDAADEIGISYPMVRRLVSAGTSRTDDRIGDEIGKIATFFTLSDVGELWRADLVETVLDPERGSAFNKKFRSRLLAERERRVAETLKPKLDELSLLNRALGFDVAAPAALTGPYGDKVAAILVSAKADTFKRIIDDYHEIVLRLGSEPDVMATKKPARA